MKRGEKKPLNERQLKFVEFFLSHGDGPRAAREAGYAPTSANNAAHDLKRDPRIKVLIEKAQEKAINQTVERAAYTYGAAMDEAEEAMRFAKEMENANAYVKAVEHRAKLSGLLIERVDLSQTVNFRIQIGGIDDGPRAVAEVEPRLYLPTKDEDAETE